MVFSLGEDVEETGIKTKSVSNGASVKRRRE